MKRKIITKEELVALHLKYWDSGLSIKKLAKGQGVGENTIYHWFRENGLPTKNKGPLRQSDKPASVADIIPHEQFAMSLREVGERLGISCEQVRQIENRAMLKIRDYINRPDKEELRERLREHLIELSWSSGGELT
uniref:Putative sigma-70 region domain containing protein n=1 Tax=viral metagenome TaxID=1070528 RepID=A0A6M3INF0_9ZZZZ